MSNCMLKEAHFYELKEDPVVFKHPVLTGDKKVKNTTSNLFAGNSSVSLFCQLFHSDVENLNGPIV